MYMAPENALIFSRHLLDSLGLSRYPKHVFESVMRKSVMSCRVLCIFEWSVFLPCQSQLKCDSRI